MTDDQHEAGGDRNSSKKAQNGAFVAIGALFLVLGISRMAEASGGVAFLVIGCAFLAMAGGSLTWQGRRTGRTRPDDDPTGDTPGPQG